MTKKVGVGGAGFEGRVRLPDNARTTLRITDNTVMWQVKVKADIDGLPDPSWAHEIIVTPALARVTAGQSVRASQTVGVSSDPC